LWVVLVILWAGGDEASDLHALDAGEKSVVLEVWIR